MDKFILNKLIDLIIENKYPATVPGQKALFNDLKKAEGFSDYSIILKELTGAEADKIGLILFYCSYECELYKENGAVFPKFNKPLKLLPKEIILKNFNSNFKKAQKRYGHIDIPEQKNVAQDIRIDAKLKKDKAYTNRADNFETEVRKTLLLIVGIPIIFFISIMPFELTWTVTDCASPFSYEERTTLQGLGVKDEYCSSRTDGISYPIVFKLLMSLVLFMHIVYAGQPVAEAFENNHNKLTSLAFFIALMPFVVSIGSFALYIPISMLMALIGLEPDYGDPYLDIFYSGY